MIETLVTSKTRIKLLVKFFLNPGTASYLRELANDLGENTNAVRVELNRLTEANFLSAFKNGQKIMYTANPEHPLFEDLNTIVSKYTGIDRLVEEVISYMGQLEEVYLIGDYAKGLDNGVIEVIVVGNIKEDYLTNFLNRLQPEVSRKVTCKVIKPENKTAFFEKYEGPQLLLYSI
jgi:hypothetical protein